MEKKTDFTVRQAIETDYPAIYNLIETAFETAEHRDGDEKDFTIGLRSSENYIPALDLVAEKDGQPIGHIMLTGTYVTRPDGSKYNALLVAPLSVLLEYRSKGVGSALMKEGLRKAAEMGYKTVFLIGDPNYYQRFGYKPTHLYGINHTTIPPEYVMVYEIIPHALDGITGIVNM